MLLQAWSRSATNYNTHGASLRRHVARAALLHVCRQLFPAIFRWGAGLNWGLARGRPVLCLDLRLVQHQRQPMAARVGAPQAGVAVHAQVRIAAPVEQHHACRAMLSSERARKTLYLMSTHDRGRWRSDAPPLQDARACAGRCRLRMHLGRHPMMGCCTGLEMFGKHAHLLIPILPVPTLQRPPAGQRTLAHVQRRAVLREHVERARAGRPGLQHHQRAVRARRVLAVHVPPCAPQAATS